MRRMLAIGLLVISMPVLSAAPGTETAGNLVVRTIPIRASQGVAVDQQHFYAISNTKIVKCDKASGNVLATWQADVKKEAYAHFKHLNSGTVVDGKLYCAHSRYGVDPNDCSIEIWDVAGEALAHERTIRLPRRHGSLTWIDRTPDGLWWMCFAVYGKEKNKKTKLVKHLLEDGNFTEVENWTFPDAVVSDWGRMSCSGGSWGPDGYLYATGHDDAIAHVLTIDADNTLRHVRTETALGFHGQAIAWDRSSPKPVLWGIVRNKHVALNHINAAAPKK